MEPGIYRDMPMRDYLAIDAINCSTLTKCEQSLAHAREFMQHPPAPTPAMEFGTHAHVAILEPGRFFAEYIAAPKVDRRTKEGKAAWSKFENEAAGRTVISQEDFDRLDAMKRAAWSHEAAVNLLAGNEHNTEVVAVWRDDTTGLLCKGRIDRLTTYQGWTVIVDLKTTADASPAAFGKSIHNYGYHVQAAFYEQGLYTLAAANRRFMFVAIEKDRPYGVAVYELDETAIETGRAKLRRYLSAWARAVETDTWPGYQPGVQRLTIPTWAIEYESWEETA